jgi:hypothetical protein
VQELLEAVKQDRDRDEVPRNRRKDMRAAQVLRPGKAACQRPPLKAVSRSMSAVANRSRGSCGHAGASISAAKRKNVRPSRLAARRV